MQMTVTIPVYWTHNLTTPGFPSAPEYGYASQLWGRYNDFYDNNPPFVGFIGIVRTPVIDKSTNTLYVVTRDVNTAIYDAGPHTDVTRITLPDFISIYMPLISVPARKKQVLRF